MGKVKRKRPYPPSKRDKQRAKHEQQLALATAPPPNEVAELAIDIWRINRRAQREGGHDRVLTACERAVDRLRKLGFELDEMKDRPYSEHLRMRVVEHEEADEERHVAECLAPAVYYKGEFIREAEVVTRGR